jgi:L-ascorbate metabolism protein UlaG (beta-lactamase superfamily)
MRVEWYGQSAFRLAGDGGSIFVDPFGDVSGLAARGLQFDYPPIENAQADLLLITHEHVDHNGTAAIAGSPPTLRSTAGRLASPIGEVVAVASEHDAAAGTERGPNTIFVFDLDGIRVAHFGDFGQSSLRDEQANAIAGVDLLFIPVGAGPTIGADQAAAIADRLEARWVVPMHYRTRRVNFLETADAFIERMPRVHLLDTPTFDTSELPEDAARLAVVPTAP